MEVLAAPHGPATFPPSAYVYHSLEPVPKTPLSPKEFEAAHTRLEQVRAELQALKEQALGKAAHRALDGAIKALEVEAELRALVKDGN